MVRPWLCLAPFWACVHSLPSPPWRWGGRSSLGREKLEDLQMFGRSVGAGWLLRAQLSSREGWVQADGEARGWRMGNRSCGVQLGDHLHPWHRLPQVQLWGSAAWVAPGAAAASSGAGKDLFRFLDSAGSVLPANRRSERFSNRTKISGCR